MFSLKKKKKAQVRGVKCYTAELSSFLWVWVAINWP